MSRGKVNTIILVTMLITSVFFKLDNTTAYAVDLGEAMESMASSDKAMYKRTITVGGKVDIKVYRQKDTLITEVQSNKTINYKDTNRGEVFDISSEGTMQKLSVLATEDIFIEVIPKEDGKLNLGVTEYYEEIDRYIERRSIVFEDVDVKKGKVLGINLFEYTEKNKRDLESGYEEYDDELEKEVKRHGTDINYRLILSNGEEMKPSIDLTRDDETEVVEDSGIKNVGKKEKSNRSLIIFIATIFIMINIYIIRNLSKKIN